MFQNQLLNAIAIVLAFFLASYVITIILSFIEKVTSKTGTDLDDKIIEAIKLPIRHLSILLGFYFGFKSYDFAWTIKGKDYTIEDLFFVLILFLLGFATSRILKTVFIWYGSREKSNINQTMFVFVRKMISVFVYSIILLIAFGQLGIQIGPLLAGLGVAGLAVALGLQTTLENLFSALFLVMDKSINIGDWIQLDDGTKAYIEDISWRSVRIRTIGGNTVIVPNSAFVNQKISSYDYPTKSFFTSVKLGVAYDSDLDKVEYVASQAAEKVIKDEGVKEQVNNPIIRYSSFGDSAINFSVIVKVDSVGDESKIQHALIKEIAKQFRENNIEIPFPQIVAEIKK